jgi:hypothetical protein
MARASPPVCHNVYFMQVLQAGEHKFIYLELDTDTITTVAEQAGFEIKIEDGARSVTAELTAPGRQSPLLLFDAADPSNLGWFSRCQFYVDGRTGAVMQTPMALANHLDRAGKPQAHSVRLTITKELPASYRLPGKKALTEQVLYSLLYNFLNALTKTGVAVCGASVVKPLAGRTES